jgi:hypothetical protein
VVERVYLLQARDQLREELAATERLVDLLRDGLIAVEALLERSPAVTGSPVPALPPSGESRPPQPEQSAPPPPESDPSRPRGSEAIERLLTEQPGRWIKVQDLTARQIERGWRPDSRDPLSAVRAAANRLVRDQPERFERSRGSYRYKGESSSRAGQDTQAAPPSDSTVSSNGSASPADTEVEPVWNRL